MPGPLGAALATLVRVGARTVAVQAGRSAARRGGAALVKQAAARTVGEAAETAAQPLVTAATRRAGQAGGRALEDTGLTNARDLTRALAGGSPGAGVAEAAAERSARLAAMHPQAAARSVAPRTIRTPQSLRAQQVARDNPAQAPQPAPDPSSTRIPGAGPDSAWKALKEFGGRQMERIRATARESFRPPSGEEFRRALQEKPRTVAEETAGMSFDQRYDRLQRSGMLLNWQQVRAQTGIGNPTRQDIVQASEQAEQEARNKQIQEIERSRIKLKDFSFTLLAAAGPLGILASTGVGLAKLPGLIERFGTSIVEARRHLMRFDGQIAREFSRLNREDVRRDARLARDTSGSSALLVRSLNQLRDDLAPIRTSVATAANLLGTIAAKGGSAAAGFFKGLTALAGIELIMRNIERALGKKGGGPTDFFMGLEDIARGRNLQPKPKNRKPNAP